MPNYKATSQRIDSLMDIQIADIKRESIATRQAVQRIEKMIVGNGSPGLLGEVASNTSNIKILLSLLLLAIAAIMGTFIKSLLA